MSTFETSISNYIEHKEKYYVIISIFLTPIGAQEVGLKSVRLRNVRGSRMRVHSGLL